MGKIKVLLVEDEITLAKIIKDTLESVGFDVCLAYDGEEGLKLFFESKPDVLISDIMMAKISGLDVVQRIRKTDQTTPVIFLTAKTEVDDVVAGFETGANDYIRKPFAMKELIVRIKALTGRISSKEESEAFIFNIGDYRFDADKCVLLYISSKEESEAFIFNIGDYRFDADKCVLLYIPTGEVEQLPNREAEVLRRFCQNFGSIVPMQNILLELDDFFCTRSLQVLITRIRHRLSKDKRVQIINIRGNGYKLTIDECMII